MFLQNTPTVAGAGYADNYTTLLTTRGQLIDKSGNRGLSYGEVANSNFMTLRCRFQTALAASLRSDTKIVIDSISYTFSTYALVDQRKHIYEFEIQSQTN